MKISSCVLLSSLFSATVAVAAPNACYFESVKLCVESDTIDLSNECGAQGGSVLSVCSAESRIASCVVTQGADKVTARYYDGTPINPEENCKENDGEFTRG